MRTKTAAAVSAESVRKYGATDAKCGCPDRRYRKRSGGCKHMKAVRNALDIVKASGVKW